MVEGFLSGLVLGLSIITILGLFVAAYFQFKRGNKFSV
jgi:cytochrome b6-f complex subunit 5|uniref:Cytochrome b6-f complex subunit 5 n=1 Tax=Poterioochromonas malhamensis TaxID=88167 RepID=A0A7T6Y7I9_9STRA|nr:subunit V of cytochrome b6/f complex [Poterioochromonas malhamensis]QQK55028.1 subunit V of cytochrome b6/f complex [Poterioochromonas malhamensis]|eukprot:gene23853-gene17965